MSSPRMLGAEAPPRFSRAWWLSVVHDLLWVTLATVLIWVYADMEYTDEAELMVTLQLHTGDSENVMLLSAPEYDITFRLSGSQSSLETFRRELADLGGVVRYDVSQDYAPSEGFQPADLLLRRAFRSADLGIQGLIVKSTEPVSLPLNLDSVERIADVPVDLVSTGAELASPPPPQRVDILVAASQWKKIQPRLTGPPRLQTQSVDLQDRKPGIHENIQAEVLPVLEGIPVRPQPSTVQFDVEIISPTDTLEMVVSVQVLTPPSWAEPDNTTWQEYSLVRQTPSDWRPRLTIVGPKKDLRPENVRAFIRLSDDDKKPTTSWWEQEVTISFPPGTNLRLQGPAPKVKYRLERRSTTGTLQ